MSAESLTEQNARLRGLGQRAVEQLPAFTRRYSGRTSVQDFGAVGDGVVDDTGAFLQALNQLRLTGGGTLFLPALRDTLTTYKVTQRLNIDFPCRIVGDHFSPVWVQFASNTGFWFLGGSSYSTVEHLTIRGNRQRYVEWAPNHNYTVGQRVRSKLAAPGTEVTTSCPNTEMDRGTHLVCVVAGQSGSSMPSWGVFEPGTVTDGGVTWQVEVDCGINIRSAFVHVHRCQISVFDDCAVSAFSDDAANFICDGWSVTECVLSACDGYGIYSSGDDSSLGRTWGNNFSDFGRGAGIKESGFFNAKHGPDNQCINSLFTYVGVTPSAEVLWEENYSEASVQGMWIEASQFAFMNHVDAIDSRSPGRVDNGVRQGRLWLTLTNGFERFFGGGQPWERWYRVGDAGYTDDEWQVADSDDPGGYLRQFWSSSTAVASRDITSLRSNRGAAKWRFPRGFYIGDQWNTFADHAPTHSDGIATVGTTIWRAGDRVWNTSVANDTDPLFWIASRNGGWGGGRAYAGGRVWSSGAGTISPGDAIEPSVSNGHVFYCFALEENVGGVWVTANYNDSLLSTSEPTWNTGSGSDTFEQTDSTHRIHWKEFGALNMDWSIGPVRSGTTTTT